MPRAFPLKYVFPAISLLGIWAAVAPPAATAAEDGKRAVDVPRFGVRVRVPQAWTVVDWSRDDRAFQLQMPQDAKSKVGHVTCRMRVANEDLAEAQKRFAAEAAAADAAEKARAAAPKPVGPVAYEVRRLLKNELSPLAAPTVPAELVERFGARKLVVEWECEDSSQRRWYERRVLMKAGDLLYDFSFDCDEAHYDSYGIDFDEMLAGLKLTGIQLPVERRPSGYWMQRDFRFGFKLAGGWEPSFGPSDRVLFFAVGSTPNASVEQLSVLASPGKPLDFAQLKAQLPDEWKKRETVPGNAVSGTAITGDMGPTVESREVAQGGVTALETIVKTRRGKSFVTIIERRFSTRTRNYEIRLTCDTASFALREAELREMLDSFAEMPAEVQASET
jgi:hypothetical protein